MASKQTSNFGLNQWGPGDRVLREEFNVDNLKIDTALAGLRDGKGNCRIITGQYTGTGTYGQHNQNTLTFDAPPLVVMICSDRLFTAVRGGSTGQIDYASTGSTVSLTWSGNRLSWYGIDARTQMNAAGTVYHYVAWLAAA